MRYCWQIEKCNSEGKWERYSVQLFDTKKEAVNARAAASLRLYQFSHNFDHDADFRIRRVKA